MDLFYVKSDKLTYLIKLEAFNSIVYSCFYWVQCCNPGCHFIFESDIFNMVFNCPPVVTSLQNLLLLRFFHYFYVLLHVCCDRVQH